MSGESYQRTCHHKIFVAENASSFVPSRLDAAIDALAAAAERNDAAALLDGMQELVPEFQPLPKPVPRVEHAEVGQDASHFDPAYTLS